MSRKVWVIVGLMGVGAVWGAMRWLGGPEGGPPKGGARAGAGAGFNVLLISIDTLRADHLGCYGHPVVKTPNIDRLASEGVRFLQCTSAVPLTLPSHASLMTGVYPFVHGARDNGSFLLHEDNVTLAEVLRDAGYETSAEVAAYVLNREFRLDQGFDTYHDVTSRPGGHATGATQGTAGERSAEDVCDAAIASLRSDAGERFFHFVHFFDPHFVYEPPERFARQYDDPYLGEIAYVDEQVGRLLGELARLGLAERTLVVLTADHGEGRFQHGEDSHGAFLFDTTLQVPLLLRCPGVLPAGTRVAAQVRTIDIAPTVLSLLGMAGLPHAQGASLLPLIGAGAAQDVEGVDDGDGGRAAYSESMLPLYNFGYAPLRALRRGGWKYIHAPKPRLYHVADDPGETRNLAQDHPERVAAMREALRRIVAEAPWVVGSGSGRRTMSEEEMQKLAALGYVGGGGRGTAGGSELDRFDPVGPDPHDHVDDILATTQAMLSMRLERFEEAEQRLRKLLEGAERERGDDVGGESATGFHWAYKNLGFVLARRGAHEEAIVYHRKALALQPEDSITMTHLAVSLASVGREKEAIAAFESALKMRPVFAHTHENYGIALSRMGRSRDAEAEFRRAVEMEPGNVNARAMLANVCMQGGRFSEAEEVLKAGLAVRPGAEVLTRLREEVSARRRRIEQAKAPFEAELARDPDQSAPHVKLAEVCLRANQVGQAEAHLRRAVAIDGRSGEAWEALAFVLLRQDKVGEAAAAFESGLAAEPENVRLTNDLAWLLAATWDAAVRDGKRALKLAEAARERSGDSDANVLATMAAALAELGRFEEAAEVLKKAVQVADEAEQGTLAEALRGRLGVYERGEVYRMEPVGDGAGAGGRRTGSGGRD